MAMADSPQSIVHRKMRNNIAKLWTTDHQLWTKLV